MTKEMSIIEKKMRLAEGNYINLYFKDGKIWKNRECTDFFSSQDEDEENMLIIESLYQIDESKIEDIEILGDIK